MKRSVAKQTLNATMADKLLIKGEDKDVAIRVDAVKTTAATMIHAAVMTAAMIAAAMIAAAMIAAAMIAAATMAVAMITAAMTVPVTATGVTTNKATPITMGVAGAMIATMTGRAVALMRLTMLTTETMLRAAPLLRTHIADPGVTLTTLASPISLMALVTPKDPIHLFLAIMPLKTITWRKISPTR